MCALQGAYGARRRRRGQARETLAEEHAAAGAISHPACGGRRRRRRQLVGGGAQSITDRATVEGAPRCSSVGAEELACASTGPWGWLHHPGGPACSAAAADADARGEGTDAPPKPPSPEPPAPLSHEDASAALFGCANSPADGRVSSRGAHPSSRVHCGGADELDGTRGGGRSIGHGRAASAIALSRHVAALEPLEQLHARLRHVLLRCLEYVRASAFSPEGGALADDFDDASTHAGTCAALSVWRRQAVEQPVEAFTAHLNACARKRAEACQDDLGEIDRLTLGSGAAMGPPTTSRSVVDRAAGGGAGQGR